MGGTLLMLAWASVRVVQPVRPTRGQIWTTQSEKQKCRTLAIDENFTSAVLEWSIAATLVRCGFAMIMEKAYVPAESMVSWCRCDGVFNKGQGLYDGIERYDFGVGRAMTIAGLAKVMW